MQGREELECFADPHALGQSGVLQLRSDEQAEPIARDIGIEAEHGRRATVGVAQPLEDLDGGGLARAVRAQQPEQLALSHRERDAADDRR